jgi:thiamine kinase-like enzyme
MMIEECKVVLKNHHLEHRSLSKKSEIRQMRHTTINAVDNRGKHLYFIKKEGQGFKLPFSLKNEIWFYNYISRQKELFKIKEYIPNFLAYDKKQKMLILESLHNYETLYSYIGRLRAFPKETSECLAKIIAYLHTTPLSHENRDIPSFCPNIPSFDRITPEILANNNDAFIEMLEIIQGDKRIYESLESLRRLTKYCLIHGDLKFDNILISKYTKPTSLKFIDWELCGWGNPHVDLGTIIGNFILSWAKSIRLRRNRRLEECIKSSNISFLGLTLAINHFLKTYQKLTKKDLPCFATISIIDIIKYAGLVNLLSVLVEAKLMYRLSSMGVLVLSLSKTLLTEPNRAVNLLNIKWQ